MSEPRSFCQRCVGLLLALGLSAFLLWLCYNPRRPAFFLLAFQLPPVAHLTPSSAATATATFTLEAENKNRQLGVLHDSLSFAFSYANRSGQEAKIPGFYQGHGKTADVTGEMAAGWVPWREAAREVARKGAAAFRVRVVSCYRYKVLLWKGRRRSLSVGAVVEVDGDGRKKEQEGIRLRSSVAPSGRGEGWALSSVVVCLITAAAAAIVPL